MFKDLCTQEMAMAPVPDRAAEVERGAVSAN